MSKLRSYILTVLILLFVIGSVQAMSPVDNEHLIEISVDNETIHTFRGTKGYWFVPGKDKETMSAVVKKSGVLLDDVKKINDQPVNQGSPVFIPMSDEHYQSLLGNGKGRRIYPMDKLKLLWPVENPFYSSRFGRRWNAMHNGLDMPVAINSIVVAAADGVIHKSGPMGDYGRAVVIRHDDGLETWYAHNTVTLLKEGEHVSRGQIIAFSGNTGRSTGPHVHFEVRYLNVAMNPEDFLQFGLTDAGSTQREALEDSLSVSDDGSVSIGRDISTFQP